jgi:prepilin-type N-terminal cleavage/methylation domain-containing protein
MNLLARRQKGFTLIELLIVIGILAVLLAIVLIAINPQENFRQANNTQRRSDVNAILNAIHQYSSQNKGALPGTITASPQIVASTGAGTINLCADLVPTYIADLPLDPSTGTESPANSICTDAAATYSTGYTVQKSTAGNRITVAAPGAEGETISVTR